MTDSALRPAPRRQLIEFGENSGQVRHADDPAYSDARVPTCHAASHTLKGSDPLIAEDIGAAPAKHKHGIEDLSGVACESHRHGIKDLDGVACAAHRHSFDDVDGVAPVRHAHTFAELSGVAAESHKHSYEDLSGVAPVKHTHGAEDINHGVFAIERLPVDAKPGAFLRVSEDGKSLEAVDLADLAAAVKELLTPEAE